jgi:hypothetical protein
VVAAHEMLDKDKTTHPLKLAALYLSLVGHSNKKVLIENSD